MSISKSKFNTARAVEEKETLPIQDSSLVVAWMCDSGLRRAGMRMAEKPMTQPWPTMLMATEAVTKHWNREDKHSLDLL